MSFAGLHIATTGLTAAQRALETAAHNVANANTVGYSRQEVKLSSQDALQAHRGIVWPRDEGSGVAVDGIFRATDALSIANLRETSAQLSAWTSRSNFFARAEQVLGPLEEGVTRDLSNFWNAWEGLSQSPENETTRQQVLNAGRALSTSINTAHERVTSIRDDVELDMRATVDRVNALSTEVAELNTLIQASLVRGDQPNDILDKRDIALLELSELTGAQVAFQADGDARVVLEGLPLVDAHRAESLDVTGTPAAVVWLIDGTPAAVGGQLGALAELAGPGTDDILADLDEMATELRDLVNVAHQAGFGLDGISGRDFFQGTDASDLSLDASLTTTTIGASTSGLGADGNHALTMGALRSAVGVGGSTIQDLSNALQGRLGLEAQHASSQADMAQVVVDEASSSVAELSGVSVDEELSDMLRFQRAYEASARVITVLDSLLDKLINGTGVTR